MGVEEGKDGVFALGSWVLVVWEVVILLGGGGVVGFEVEGVMIF